MNINTLGPDICYPFIIVEVIKQDSLNLFDKVKK